MNECGTPGREWWRLKLCILLNQMDFGLLSVHQLSSTMFWGTKEVTYFIYLFSFVKISYACVVFYLKCVVFCIWKVYTGLLIGKTKWSDSCVYRLSIYLLLKRCRSQICGLTGNLSGNLLISVLLWSKTEPLSCTFSFSSRMQRYLHNLWNAVL